MDKKTDDFEFKCPSCGSILAAQTEWIGAKAPCPVCQKELVIPEPSKIQLTIVKANLRQGIAIGDILGNEKDDFFVLNSPNGVIDKHLFYACSADAYG